MLNVIVAFLSFSIIPCAALSQSEDEIKTLAPWNMDHPVSISIINDAGLIPNKILLIEKVINSSSEYTENGHTYFEGWEGAIQTVNPNVKFEINKSENGISGDIILKLTKEASTDYNGITVPTYAGTNMAHATITIYDANKITPVQLENLVRHEMGHALGLGHSTSINSMMYQVIQPDEKYISACDIAGLNALFGGDFFQEVSC